ncbi:MAG: hypothetical protein ABIQ40_20105 [Bacteroidia bacterium]
MEKITLTAAGRKRHKLLVEMVKEIALASSALMLAGNKKKRINKLYPV